VISPLARDLKRLIREAVGQGRYGGDETARFIVQLLIPVGLRAEGGPSRKRLCRSSGGVNGEARLTARAVPAGSAEEIRENCP